MNWLEQIKADRAAQYFLDNEVPRLRTLLRDKIYEVLGKNKEENLRVNCVKLNRWVIVKVQSSGSLFLYIEDPRFDTPQVPSQSVELEILTSLLAQLDIR